MTAIHNPAARAPEIVDLFTSTFAVSDGPTEGDAIGALVQALLDQTPKEDLWIFAAEEVSKLIGCILLTRLRYSEDKRVVFLLAPVAIDPAHQRQGRGRQLIREALDTLTAAGVDVVLTYGDPAFYGKVGFKPVSETDVPAPYPLSQPIGWQGVALGDAQLDKLHGSAQCVTAFNRPEHW